QRELLVVEDAYTDPRFADNPLVRQDPGIRFYAGAPLVTADGHAIGSLGVMDRVARGLSPLQEQALRVLAHEVVAQIELRSKLEETRALLAERDQAQQALERSHMQLEREVQARTEDLQQANRALNASAQRAVREALLSQAIIDSLPGLVYVLDCKGRFLRWNRNYESIAGYSADEMVHARVEDFFPDPDQREQVMQALHGVLAGASNSVEADFLTRSGERIPYFFTGAPIELDGRAGVCGMGVDISARRRAEEALRLRDRAVQASVNAIIITDLASNITFVNPAFERITGYTMNEALGRNCRFLQAGDRDQPALATLRAAVDRREECAVLLRNYRKDGTLFWNDVHIAPVRDPHGEVTHFVGVINDMTAIKRYEQELERLINVDALTTLASRKVLHDRLRAAIATAHRLGTTVVVGFIDLDNFKFINESLGHTIGDALLKSVATRLLSCLQGEDTVARYGGDEFAFILVGYNDETQVGMLVDKILKTIDQPFYVEEHQFFVSCSIGLSLYPRDGDDADTLLKNADAAMHLAKERGRNNFQFFTPAMSRRVTERLSMEASLRRALANDEFELHYQPKLDLRTSQVVGAEALLRWFPRHGRGPVSIPPSAFIPLAEETGLINAIGEWVLHTACAHNKALQARGLPPLRMAVNISARQFEPKTIVSLVQRALSASGLAAASLELELTESLVMRNPEEAIRVLGELKEMGLCLAIDDFGTGYSSLSQLQRFPVDLLKIDQSFVRDIGADPNDAIIARAVISLGHSLGLDVIAEGVSSQEQLTFLRENGCDEIQGYLFSPPLPMEDLVRFIQEPRPPGNVVPKGA
ncbi:MAG TPA: EAL domain-containing protein, partial [Noviherbaspirillum sp.]|nr:EAL domain-containing protein [Noviherbaspirillum sp.]